MAVETADEDESDTCEFITAAFSCDLQYAI